MFKVEVLFDSLATESRMFKTFDEARRFANEMQAQDGVWEAHIRQESRSSIPKSWRADGRNFID